MENLIPGMDMVEAYYCGMLQILYAEIIYPVFQGPISEELAFRSCTAVLINYCFGWSSSLFISPLFFSLCHFHHIHNDLKEGATLSNAILQRGLWLVIKSA
jgi:hypothetical protein